GIFAHHGVLAPGDSYTSEQTVTLSPEIAGKYVIVYGNYLDAGGHLGGTWEGPYTQNNTLSALTQILPTQADLQVTSVVTPPQNFSGEQATIRWTVTNFGDPVWSHTQFWSDTVYLSPDATFLP